MEPLLHFGFAKTDAKQGVSRTSQEEVAKFFQALTPALVVIEVGTHPPGCRKSSLVRDTGCWWLTRG